MHNNLLIEKESKLFLRYTIPSVLGMIGFSLYILSDTYFVANGIGPVALGALNIAIPIYSFIAAMAILIGVGGSTVLSIYKGKGKEENINDVFSMSILNSAILSVIILIIGIFFSKNIAILLGPTGVTLDYVAVYLKVIMVLCPLMIFSNVLINFVRNDGKPKIAMISMVIGTLLNIVFDYIFIYIFQWGMFGAALATAVSPTISLIIGVYFIKRDSTLRLKKFKYSLSMFRETINCGVSSFISEISIGVVVFLFNIVILKISGEMAVAAYGIITNIALVCICIFNGIAQGMQPIISVNFGDNRHERIRKTLWIGIGAATILGILFYFIGLLFPKEITAIFNGHNSEELTNITVSGIKLYFIAFIFMGINTVIISFYQSTLKAKEAFILSMLRGFVLIAVGLFVLTPILGITGVWLVVPITEITTFILCSGSLIRHLAIEGNRQRQEEINTLENI